MSDTLTYAGELTIVTCWCGMRHGVPKELREFQLRERDNGRSKSVFCPIGHSYSPSGESRVKKLEQQLEQANRIIDTKRREVDLANSARDTAMRSSRAQKGINRVLKKRIAAGKCPCCHEDFKNILEHMKEQHPSYAAED